MNALVECGWVVEYCDARIETQPHSQVTQTESDCLDTNQVGEGRARRARPESEQER